jgi:outer membrane lipoprotein SlyB
MKIRAMTLVVSAALLTACATPGYYGRPYGGPYDQPHGRPYDQPYGGQPYVDPRPGRCGNCGLVERIERVSGQGGGASGGGAVLGAIVGGVLGNTVGKGDGRKAATVAGAVAGGLIGNEIERNQAGGGDTWYEVFVRMDNGERIVTRQYGIAGLREGSRVEIRDGAAFPR